MKINWKQKLASRKFWVAIVGVAMFVVTTFYSTKFSAEQLELANKVTYLLIAYIFGESAVDIAKTIKAADVDNDGILELDEIVDAVIDVLNEREVSEDAN